MNGVRTALRGLGQTLITFGIVILLFCAYELWFTNIYTNREQSQLRHANPDILSSAPPPPGLPEFADVSPGQGIAVLRIPRLGRGYLKVIVEGVSVGDLKKGPGHYPHTALPGQIGNFVVSGHRTTYGAPFNRLDEVKPGDDVIIETRTTWYIYRETHEQKVAPTALWVTFPVPNQPGVRPTKRLLTFTTCNPKYSARQRLILFAELVSSRPKSAGPPPEITGGG